MTGLREYLENLTDDVFEQDEIESHMMDTDFEKICARTYGYRYTAERVVSKMQEMRF